MGRALTAVALLLFWTLVVAGWAVAVVIVAALAHIGWSLV